MSGGQRGGHKGRSRNYEETRPARGAHSQGMTRESHGNPGFSKRRPFDLEEEGLLNVGGLVGSGVLFCDFGVIETDLTWRALRLGYRDNGGVLQVVNAEPSGWRDAGFDDSAWASVVAGYDTLDTALFSITTAPGGMWRYDEMLVRREFYVDADAVGAGTVQFRFTADDYAILWINGTLVSTLGTPGGAGVFTDTAEIARSLFVEGLNSIAIYAKNQDAGVNGTGPNPGGMAVALRISIHVADSDLGSRTHVAGCGHRHRLDQLLGQLPADRINGLLDLGWFNVEDYGAVHDGTTNDRLAIQAAIDAVFAVGGGTLFFPSGRYYLGNTLQQTGTYNSLLTLPQVNAPARIGIRFLGPATLVTDWAGIISGNPSVISAGTHDSLTLNQVFVTWESVRIEVPVNPKLSGIDMTKAATFRWRGLSMAPVSAPSALPTNTNAVGLDLPWGLNDQNSGGDTLWVDGFYTGVRPSEQMIADAMYLSFCARAVEMRGAQGPPEYLAHSATIQRLNVWFCQRGIVATGDLRWLHVGLMDVEHDDPSFVTVYDIDDASNFLRGLVRLHTTDYVTGAAVDAPLINGADGLSLHLPHGMRWRLASIVDVPIGTNPLTNPATGRRLYADSATGALTVRKPDGSTASLEGSTFNHGAVDHSTIGHYELLMTGSPPTPLEDGTGIDWLYVWVNP